MGVFFFFAASHYSKLSATKADSQPLYLSTEILEILISVKKVISATTVNNDCKQRLSATTIRTTIICKEIFC